MPVGSTPLRAVRRSLVPALLSAACASSSPPRAETPSAPKPPDSSAQAGAPLALPTPADADAFVAQVNTELKELWSDAERINWVKATYITDDTEKLAAEAQERVMEYLMRRIKEARRFDGLALSADTARSLYLLKYSAGLPAPADAGERAELAEIASKMESVYGKGKYCSAKLKGRGKDKASSCLDLGELSDVLATSRDADLLLEVWRGWHTVSVPMRPLYRRFVELGNKGARDLGFRDMGEIWTARYDMSSQAFVREMERLYEEVKPLYEDLHCYVRAKLRKRYGADKIGEKAPIPAHLLGNMWAQEWANLYPLVEPFPGKGQPDITRRLVAKQYDAHKLVRLGEQFFVSLGLDPLPNTFWQRSLFEKPRDREVVCHASAWDVDMSGDLRIKMCIQVNHEDLVTIHHELGHNYYFHYYNHRPPLFQAGANDGFHEGIGDTLALSVTPEYLAKVGVFERAPAVSAEADVNLLMQRALEGIAFLPFGKLIDQWRWDVFSGKTPPEAYNAAWWQLRKKYQGVDAPSARTEQDFDPGAKYHIPANVPYTRYFIARILQYQFHRGLCKVAGHTGPLHRCSIHGNEAAGAKLKALLALGASKSWPEALREMTGESKMDATAIIDYYRPLTEWLRAQNASSVCGWE
ncbi:MAG TPA: M2 family metallopeptidase [Polyangiaceae bacterium]